MSIDEALMAGSFHPQFDRTICTGDIDKAFAGEDVACVVEGEARMGGQEHFYLEPHCNFVVPLESDEFLLVASTQVCLCRVARCYKNVICAYHCVFDYNISQRSLLAKAAEVQDVDEHQKLVVGALGIPC